MVRVEAGYCRGGDPEQSQAQVGGWCQLETGSSSMAAGGRRHRHGELVGAGRGLLGC